MENIGGQGQIYGGGYDLKKPIFSLYLMDERGLETNSPTN